MDNDCVLCMSFDLSNTSFLEYIFEEDKDSKSLLAKKKGLVHIGGGVYVKKGEENKPNTKRFEYKNGDFKPLDFKAEKQLAQQPHGQLPKHQTKQQPETSKGSKIEKGVKPTEKIGGTETHKENSDRLIKLFPNSFDNSPSTTFAILSSMPELHSDILVDAIEKLMKGTPLKESEKKILSMYVTVDANGKSLRIVTSNNRNRIKIIRNQGTKSLFENIVKYIAPQTPKEKVSEITKPQNVMHVDGGGMYITESFGKIGQIKTDNTPESHVRASLVQDEHFFLIKEGASIVKSDTPEGRKKYIKANIQTIRNIANRLKEVDEDYASATSKFVEQMEKANTPDSFKEAFVNYLIECAELDTRKNVPSSERLSANALKNIGEIFLYHLALLEGKEAYMPSSGNFPIADYIIVDRNKNNIEAKSLSFISVKSGDSMTSLGAASGPSAHLEVMVFNDEDTPTHESIKSFFNEVLILASKKASASGGWEELKKKIKRMGDVLLKNSKLTKSQKDRIKEVMELAGKVNEKTYTVPSNLKELSYKVGQNMLACGTNYTAVYQGILVSNELMQILEIAPCIDENGLHGFKPHDPGEKSSGINWKLDPRISCYAKPE